ncbi:unnamed protein product [Prorocentrum cordatum]|uniref:Uncharacterized protein n=1 Tax=Prorocentrum cordatum TaxID=2364126 RepID=A0ABN9X1A6_9DINO|nr:unnamed protein product [Polarella glacialis]
MALLVDELRRVVCRVHLGGLDLLRDGCGRLASPADGVNHELHLVVRVAVVRCASSMRLSSEIATQTSLVSCSAARCTKYCAQRNSNLHRRGTAWASFALGHSPFLATSKHEAPAPVP